MPARSPNYPAIGLSEAVSLLEKLWRADGASLVPIASAVEAMGFHGYSGPTRTKVSALRKYGLVDTRGQDIRVTELGKRVAKPLSVDERVQALAEAATTPELFRELASRYPDASDTTLQAVLERQGFSSDGARKAVVAYRDALTFANLDHQDYDEDDHGDDEGDNKPDSPGTRNRKRDREQRMSVVSFQVGGRIVELAAPGEPLTKAEIEAISEYLKVAAKFAPDAVSPQPQVEPPTGNLIPPDQPAEPDA